MIALIIFLKIIILVLVGIPLAYLFDSDGWFFQMVNTVDDRYVMTSYLWACYTVTVMTLLYFVFRINSNMNRYQAIPLVPYPEKMANRVWIICFVSGILCTLILYVQNNFTHPAIASVGLDFMEYARYRIATANTINMSIYNIGLNFFITICICISIFYVKSRIKIGLSVFMYLLLGTFSLDKSMMADSLFVVIIFYLMIMRPTLKQISFIASAILLIIITMYSLSKTGVSLYDIIFNIFGRVAYGQIAALPLHFSYFDDNSVSFVSILPPYIKSFLNIAADTPGRIIMEKLVNPFGALDGTVGVASTFFIGDSYAVFNIFGVLLSPFLVMVNFAFLVCIFTRMEKSFMNIFMFSYFIYKLQYGLFGSVSTFIFSGYHITLFLYLIFCFVQYVLSKKPREQMGRKNMLPDLST